MCKCNRAGHSLGTSGPARICSAQYITIPVTGRSCVGEVLVPNLYRTTSLTDYVSFQPIVQRNDKSHLKTGHNYSHLDHFKLIQNHLTVPRCRSVFYITEKGL
jgi:hypothetical protein